MPLVLSSHSPKAQVPNYDDSGTRYEPGSEGVGEGNMTKWKVTLKDKSSSVVEADTFEVLGSGAILFTGPGKDRLQVGHALWHEVEKLS